MLQLVFLGSFIKDSEKTKRRGKNMQKFEEIIQLLIEQKPLSIKYRNHKLTGNFVGYWECHIEPDWLLIYKKTATAIILTRMGTHSDLF